ncbi:MAG: class I SAM-dependent methyltransferase [Chloroflexi bacterium]|nr:class I SAM-dependent methyltransferase [Chloroflexota bacterium]
MSTNPNIKVIGSLTARFNRDPLGLGRTSGQRGAEIIAGIRAELMRTPETIALSRLGGRLTARTMMALEREDMFNYIPARFEIMTDMALKHTPFDSASTLVEIAAGFSPRALHLARRIPEANVLEIDLPDVIAEKRKRLEKNPQIRIPANLTWRAADLSQQMLSEVLNHKLVDMILAEEMLLYFPLEDCQHILQQISLSLRRGAYLVTSIGFRPGIQQAHKAARFFNRQAGNFLGVVDQPEEARQLFESSGYVDVQVERISALATKMNLAEVPADVELMVLARRP